MGSKQFTIHKIARALDASIPVTKNTLERYEKLNSKAGIEAELALQYILEADKLACSGLYIEAISVYDKAIASANGDPGIKVRCRRLIRSMVDQVQNLAIDNIADVRIGPLYDYFFKIGHLPIVVQAYAALHFIRVGEVEKAKKIITRVKKVAPHFRLLKITEKKYEQQ